MADQRSVEMLAFNFARRTFAYKRLAQCLSRFVSAFSSFRREYLDPVVKADQSAQYVDDIGIAAINATELNRNIRSVFTCIHQAGLKLTIDKWHFGLRQIEEKFHQKETHHKPRQFKISLTNLDSPNRKSHYNDIWVPWTLTENIFPEWPKNPFRSANCLKRKCRSIFRQSWMKHLIQSIKLSVTLTNYHWSSPFQESSSS